MDVFCPECGERARLATARWRCRCGGAWEPAERGDFELGLVEQRDFSLWRYLRLFGLDFATPAVRLGMGWTPLVRLAWNGRSIVLKLEYLSPTSSFKDRGTEVMINILAHEGVAHVVDDSSGNAGASVAAYAAAAGMRAHIFVPAYASSAKQAQIAVYGAQVHAVPGTRADAKAAALEAVREGAVLASHAYHPGFLLGQQSVAWEVWEQLGGCVPDWFVVPVGQGGHLLGAWLGFRRLVAAGLADRLPRLVAVQPALLAPVCNAFDAGREVVPPVQASAPSVAEGLAIAQPVRGRRLLQAIRDSRGRCVTVTEAAIGEAQQRLARRGLYVEPTSATALAALDALLPQIPSDETVLVPLTGSGLKGSPRV